MDAPTIVSLAERLEQLEGENRRLKRRTRLLERGGLLLVLVGTSVLAIGGALPDEKPKTIEAERFVIRGEDGKVYGELGLLRSEDGSTSGATRLAFFDGDGNYRTNYGVGSNHSPYLHFMDDKEVILGSMREVDGRISLGFQDQSGATGISMGSSEFGSAISLKRADGKEGKGLRQVGSLVVGEIGSELNFFRPQTASGTDVHPRVSLGIRPDGSAGLVLKGQDDESGIRAGVSSEGKSRLTMDRDALR